jgi:hypothetical protein
MSRSETIGRFSTYLSLGDREGRTAIAPIQKSNPILRNIMEFLVGTQTPTSTESWARYFLMNILESPKLYWFFYRTNFPLAGVSYYTFYIDIFRKFLFCYFQPACWKAASQVYREFQNNSYIALQYPLEECFVIASTATYKPEKLLRRFNFQSQFTLQDYTFNSIKRIIRNQVSRELKLENIKFSDYGLLRRIHEGELKNYLLQYSGSSLDRPLEFYCLAWQAFNECADEWLAATNSSQTNGNRNAVLKYMSGDRLEKIAERYNQYLQRRSQPTSDRTLVSPIETVDGSEIEQMLETCARATRHCQNARSFPLDPQEDFSDPKQTPFDILASTEEQEHLQGIKKVIVQRFQQLDSKTQTCLQLWLGLGFNQSDFLTFLNLKKQYQVARHFQRFQKELLKAVFDYVTQQLDDFPQSEAGEVDYVLKDCLMYIKEFLTQTCTDFFGDLLVDIVTKRMSISQRRDLLASLRESNSPPQFFGHLPSATDLPSGVPISPSGENLEENSTKKPSERIARVHQQLYEAFWADVEANLQVDLGQFPSSPNSIATFIEKWLRDNHAVLYQT